MKSTFLWYDFKLRPLINFGNLKEKLPNVSKNWRFPACPIFLIDLKKVIVHRKESLPFALVQYKKKVFRSQKDLII